MGAAEQLSTIANIAFTAAHQQVIYQVSLAYYTHAAALARVATSQKALENARAIEVATHARGSQGLGTVVEAAQAQQIVAVGQLAQIQAQGQADNTYLALIAALGLSPLTHLQVADVAHRRLTPGYTRTD